MVSAANYIARQYGVHSAMPAATAKRLCPMPYSCPRGSSSTQKSPASSPLVEPLSLEEAFLDVTGSKRLFGSAAEIGRKIKATVREETRLVVSVGVAPNKFLAKIASDLEKPDAFVIVDPNRIREFLDPLPVERLWGVGRQGSKVFDRLGIRTIGQLRRWPLTALQDRFGTHGEHLWQLAHGIDERSVAGVA